MPNPLSWLGAVMPEDDGFTPSPEQIRAEEERKRRQRAEFPQWKKDANLLADIAGDFVGGLTGFGGSEGQTATNVGELISAATDLIPGKAAAAKGLALAGMPLAAYRKSGKLPAGLTRAQRSSYDIIDEARIGGRDRGNVHGRGVYAGGHPKVAKSFHEMYQEEGGPVVGKIRQIDADAENVLDLIDADPADIHKIIRAMPEEIASRHMDYFNEMIKKGKTSAEAYNDLAKLISVPDEALGKAGFDAIRYPYGGKDAWMFPLETPVYRVEEGQRLPFNQAALNKRRAGQPPVTGISAAPEGMKVPPGAILPSGRRMPVRTEIQKAGPDPKPVTQRMSIAELFAQPSKTPTEGVVTAGGGKKLTLDEIKKLLNK